MRFHGKTFGFTVCSSTQFVVHIGQESRNVPWTFVTSNRGLLSVKAGAAAFKSGVECVIARADSTAEQSRKDINYSISDCIPNRKNCPSQRQVPEVIQIPRERPGVTGRGHCFGSPTRSAVHALLLFAPANVLVERATRSLLERIRPVSESVVIDLPKENSTQTKPKTVKR